MFSMGHSTGMLGRMKTSGAHIKDEKSSSIKWRALGSLSVCFGLSGFLFGPALLVGFLLGYYAWLHEMRAEHSDTKTKVIAATGTILSLLFIIYIALRIAFNI